MSHGSAIRPARETEISFLREMLYEAAAVSDVIKAMGKDAALSLPDIRLYLEGWGRNGDCALVAYCDEKGLAGAVWCRLFSEESHAYGFVASDIPEITIGVLPEMRGRGIGTKLLKAMIETSRNNKLRALSLSVDRQNAALRLYERLGFRDAGISKASDSSATMILYL